MRWLLNGQELGAGVVHQHVSDFGAAFPLCVHSSILCMDVARCGGEFRTNNRLRGDASEMVWRCCRMGRRLRVGMRKSDSWNTVTRATALRRSPDDCYDRPYRIFGDVRPDEFGAIECAKSSTSSGSGNTTAESPSEPVGFRIEPP